MGQYQSHAITQVEKGFLLSPLSQARTVGSLDWRRLPVQVRGQVEVETIYPSMVGGAVLMSIPIKRQWQINLVYLTNGVPVRRVDINDKHDGWGITTHLHEYNPADGSEAASHLPNFPGPPISPLVEVEDLEAAFRAFAELCHIEVGPSCWNPPDWR